MEIRKYTTSDKEAVMELLELNIPAFFDPSEKEDLEYYLAHEVEDYFVVIEDAQIIGAGGINYFSEEKTARLSWDMISPQSQGKGIGKELTGYRMVYLSEKPEIDFLVVRTTQMAFRFYEKMGFTLEKVEKDFWANNFDLYLMKLSVNHIV